MRASGHRFARPAALAFSALLHLAAFWWALGLPHPPAAAGPTPLVWLETEPPPPPPPAVPAAAPTPPAPTSRTRPQAKQAVRAPAPTLSDVPLATLGLATDGGTPAPPLDLAEAFPSVYGPDRHASSSNGRTLRPEDMPSPAVLQAQEKARVEARVGGWAQDAMAERRVLNGLVDPFYYQVRQGLRAALSAPPPFRHTAALAKNLALKQQREVEGYGKGGAPYQDAPIAERGRSDVYSHQQLHGGAEQQRMANAMVGLNQIYTSVEQTLGERPVAIVEVVRREPQAPLQLQLLQTSGDEAFDEYVLSKLPDALAQLTAKEDAGRGESRSVWSFRHSTPVKVELLKVY